MSGSQNPPKIKFNQESQENLDSIRESKLSVLCGRNNSGKSFLQRYLVKDIGSDAFYLGPARYNNFTHLSAYSPNNQSKEKKWKNLVNRFHNNRQNVDNSPLNLGNAIAELTNKKRDVLFGLLSDLLGSEIEIAHSVPNNNMSRKYVKVDGHNLSYTSSGFRLAATLLTALLNSDHSTFLIDEPELGLSPEIQGILSDFLFDESQRAEYFPHIESLILATHSPIFISRQKIDANYFISKENNTLTISQMSTVQDLNSLQFFLLGNRFETLFLPSIILLVEGICDYKYINKIVSTKYPDSNISVIQCNGDSRMKQIVSIANQMLQNINNSPYSNRIFAVLDKVHGDSLKQKLSQMGIKEENIITWSKNGIEYLYPKEILQQKFGEYEELNIQDDLISVNGVNLKKNDLAEHVVNRYSSDISLPKELNEKLISRIDDLVY